MPNEQKPWEQRPGESDAAYARFLIYRNLGPARSLAAAYALTASNRNKTRGAKKRNNAANKTVSGTWTQESAHFEWAKRVAAWDIAVLTEHGQSAVINFIHAVEQISLKALQTLANPNVKPRGWKGALETLVILGSVIPPETAIAILANADPDRTDAAEQPPTSSAS